MTDTLMPKHIVRNVLLEKKDYRIVRKVAEEKGLGGKGFSAALRLIIREWADLQPKPSEKSNHNQAQA
jgi:hypothetical protein